MFENQNLPFTLTVPEMAALLKINRIKGYELAARKDFPSIKIGKRIIIPTSNFLAWLENECSNNELPK